MIWTVIQVILLIVGVLFFGGRVGVPEISLIFLLDSLTSIIVVIIGNLVIFTNEVNKLQGQGVDIEGEVKEEHVDKILENEKVVGSMRHLRRMQRSIVMSLLIGIALYFIGI